MEPSPLPRFVLRRRVGRLRLLPSCSVCIAMSPFYGSVRTPRCRRQPHGHCYVGQRRGTQPIQARTASAGGRHPEGRNRARHERSGAPAQRVAGRPRERYAHTEVAAHGRLLICASVVTLCGCVLRPWLDGLFSWLTETVLGWP